MGVKAPDDVAQIKALMGKGRIERRSFRMSRVKVIAAAVFALVAFSAMLASNASAASWKINGTELKGSAALATSGVVDAAATLNQPANSIKISCSGPTLDGTKPLISGTNHGQAESLTFLGCTESSPANCSVKSSIPTEPVNAEVSTHGTTEDRVLFTPASANLFATIEFSGGTCAVAGEKPVNGRVIIGAPTGQTELVAQPIVGLGSVENNSLQLAGHPAYIEGGRALLTLASGAKWAFK
jgi:hypothetical protein